MDKFDNKEEKDINGGYNPGIFTIVECPWCYSQVKFYYKNNKTIICQECGCVFNPLTKLITTEGDPNKHDTNKRVNKIM